jgi:IMP dehydrogenase
MRKGSATRYGHNNTSAKLNKVAPEGIEALKEVTGSVYQVLAPLAGGVQSGLGYLGAKNLTEHRAKARYIRITPAGQREAAPHDVIEIKAGS